MRTTLWAAMPLLLGLAAGRLWADDKKLGDVVPPREIAGKSLNDWVNEIKSRGDPGVTENAIRTVLHFGTDARKAGPTLIECLGSNDSSIRANAAVALGTLNTELHKEDLAKAVVALGNRLEDPQRVVRFHSALALAKFGTEGKAALGKLIVATQDESCWEVRKASVVAMGAVAAGEKLKPAELHAFAALQNALVNDRCAQVRVEAAVAIAILGRPAAPGEAANLAKALQERIAYDKDKGVIIWSRVAYMVVDEITETHLKEIAKQLKDPSVQVRGYALKALSTIGAKAEAHITEMRALLNDKEPIVAAAAATALTQMDKDNQENKRIPKITSRLRAEVVPLIKERLKDPDLDEDLRRTFKAALELFGDKPGENPGK